MKSQHARDVALQAMFLFQGAVGSPNYDGDRHGGQIGLASDLLPYAEATAAFLKPYETATTDWPGVFEYDVTEEMGAWFVAHPEADIDEFVEELRRSTKAYFDRAFLDRVLWYAKTRWLWDDPSCITEMLELKPPLAGQTAEEWVDAEAEKYGLLDPRDFV